MAETLVSFDPNALVGAKARGRYAYLPTSADITSVEQWATVFAPAVSEAGGWGAVVKSLTEAPSAIRFANMTTMPGSYDRHLLQWPGLQPSVLRKLANEGNLIIHAVHQQRLLDIGRYSAPSSHIWKPGWRIEMREAGQQPGADELRDIQDATRFLTNGNIETKWDARARDAANLTNFRRFLQEFARDSLRFDLAAVWTDMDLKGRVKAFRTMPAGNIMLADAKGYMDKKPVFAVGCDDANTVLEEFTRDRLAVFVRNPRTDPGVGGYGFPETEMALRVIQAFTNAFDMNADLFTKSAVPNGLLKLKGLWTPKQVDSMSRIWRNLKTGPTKTHALPAVNIPKDGDIELLDLSNIAEHDILYRDYINMMGGLYCAITGFNVRRLGYKLSGSGSDGAPKAGMDDSDLVDDTDPALAPLLEGIEEFVTEYLIWPSWPHLRMRFYGKNPKEDARAYEARKNAMTLGEMRTMNDLPPLTDGAKKDDKELLQLMERCPNDPGLAGVFQALASAKLGAAANDEGGDGARMAPNKDPAKSEKHGATSGVRRDSAKEKGKVAKADGYMRSLYVCRRVQNADEIRRWAEGQGFTDVLAADDLHITICFSREECDWFAAGEDAASLVIPAGGPRAVAPLGDKGAVVLLLASTALQWRWHAFRDIGASWDFDGYRPHMTISYRSSDLDLSKVEPYQGEIVLGPEVFAEVDDSWVDKRRA